MIDLGRRDCLAGLASLCLVPTIVSAAVRLPADPIPNRAGLTLINNLPWWDALGWCAQCQLPTALDTFDASARTAADGFLIA